MSGLFQPPPDREVLELPLNIAPEDIDLHDHVNNVVYLRWVQDAATVHWRARASAEQQARWVWIVRRHEIDYLRPLTLVDRAIARTWVGAPRGPRFDRFVSIESADGVCAQARSEWIMLDGNTRRPARIPPEILAPFVREAFAVPGRVLSSSPSA